MHNILVVDSCNVTKSDSRFIKAKSTMQQLKFQNAKLLRKKYVN